ncbi:phospholipase A [Photobacterium sp. SDRW27]|uniref:phospholipase A n=1 Tax=Photobacterium obscurum TaxID=2829490 RepID=UPI002243E4E6|nr:phospholipase A [Photobacterium obscurum]MCW8332104.1 phospholipase A [Photobacterium obscurum]
MQKALLFASVVASFPLLAKTPNNIGIYDDTYFIGSYTNNINEQAYDASEYEELSDLMSAEAKFQFSVSVPLVRLGGMNALMGSYTQKSLWQVGNTEMSSPFRETNYKPQVFMMHQGNYPLFNSIEYGYRHESNGRGGDISRSWERFYLLLEKLGGPLEYGIEGWYASSLSDNPDIEDYIAPYSLWMAVNGPTGTIKVKGSFNYDTHRGGVELGYSYPLNPFVNLYAQLWNGYGETLIDYNHHQTRVGLGLMLHAGIFR